MAGHSVAELTAIGEEVYDEAMAGRIWPGTRALAMGHLERGQEVWLVTATPVEVAQVIARRLGLSGALGTVAESVDGVYTGRLVGEPLHGAAKARAVTALAQEKGLDLSRCAAYSDSANDIPLLSLVGHPCAVNPDAALLEHARARAGRSWTTAGGAGPRSWACGPLRRPPSPARWPPRPAAAAPDPAPRPRVLGDRMLATGRAVLPEFAHRVPGFGHCGASGRGGGAGVGQKKTERRCISRA